MEWNKNKRKGNFAMALGLGDASEVAGSVGTGTEGPGSEVEVLESEVRVPLTITPLLGEHRLDA
jgi:hypothetical protein